MSAIAEPLSKRELKLRARMAEVLLVVVTSEQCGDDLREYVVEMGAKLGLLQVEHPGTR